MLASTKKTALKSSLNSSLSTSTKPKPSFLVYIYTSIKEALSKVFLFSRKCLWGSSIVLIVVILPFAFAYFLEMEKELRKIQGMENSRAALL